MKENEIQVVIVGGGFAGVSAALALERKYIANIKIRLISDKPHFEYHPALYRVVTGNSPLEVCIPLKEIFEGRNIEITQDTIGAIDRERSMVMGKSGSEYQFDYLVVALGSETNYFEISGLQEYSFGMKSITEALRLKEHISETLLTCRADSTNKGQQVCDANFVVIGAGATGVEMAGQLIAYARYLSVEYGLDPSLVSVELVEAAARILPGLPAAFTGRIERRLRELGVNIFLNRAVEKEEVDSVYMRDMEMRTRTVIWTAGVKANSHYALFGFPTDKRGRVTVDEHLRVQGEQGIFAAGDGAATKHSGWAQTAFYDGAYIAEAISCDISGRAMDTYRPKPAINAIPVGPLWAGVLWGNRTYYGRFGWWLRRAADLHVFFSILPFGKAVSVFMKGKSICDTCTVCAAVDASTRT